MPESQRLTLFAALAQIPDPRHRQGRRHSLLASLILEGAVVTGDAISCQKELCADVVEHKGDYLFVVKDNQPSLKGGNAEAFEMPVSPLRGAALAG